MSSLRESDNIEIIGASENNLKHIDVTIPKGKLVVFAGVSGSGKSSLAFDTVAVESEREWQQSYPLFLRNKMPHYDRPKVDEILPLRWRDRKVLLYLYRPKLLERDLRDPLSRKLLSECGYECEGANACLAKLISRMRTEEGFPHEVGLFLGYPPADVDGFMHRKNGCKLCGLWKVYDDVQGAISHEIGLYPNHAIDKSPVIDYNEMVNYRTFLSDCEVAS